SRSPLIRKIFPHECQRLAVGVWDSCSLAISRWSFALRIDQCEVRPGIVLFVQRNRVHGDENLEGGEDNRLDHVSPDGSSVAMSHDHMRVKRGPPLIECEVADHGQNLDLLVDWDLSIHFLFPIKPRDDRSAKRSNGRKVATGDVM